MHLMQGANEQISERRHPNEPQGATAARLQACLPATGRRRVAAPQQPQQWLQQWRKNCLRCSIGFIGYRGSRRLISDLFGSSVPRFTHLRRASATPRR